MTRSDLNISRKLNQQSISILMIIVLPLVSALCKFENTSNAQISSEILASHHVDEDFHFDELSGQPTHSHGSTQNEENGGPCCDQLSSIRYANTLFGLSASAHQLVMSSSVIYTYIDKSDVEIFQSSKEYLSTHSPSDLVPKENSYYLALPSHAPPFSS